MKSDELAARKLPSFSPARRRALWVHAMVGSLALGVIVVGLNYLAVRHPQRWVTRGAHRYALSPLTRGLVGSLTNEVQVTVLYNGDRRDSLHSSITGLLKEYANLNPLVRLQTVDSVRQRRVAQWVRHRLNLGQEATGDLVIFETAGRRRIVRENELSDYDVEALFRGEREVKRSAFKGELLFTSAILNTMDPEPIQVYCTTGHGEHRLDETGSSGYSRFEGVLREKNLEVKTLDLRKGGPVPEGARLWVIAGPTLPFLREEVEKIESFVSRGGSLLLLFNFNGLSRPSGLGPLLRKWGVQVGRNVVDDVQTLRKNDLFVSHFSAHPVMAPLIKGRIALLLFLPRSLTQLALRKDDPAGSIRFIPLAQTTIHGVTKSDRRSGVPVFDALRDQRGSIPLIVALENLPTQPGVAASGRAVIAGDSFFLSNGRILRQGNRDFAGLAVNWLLDRFQLLQGIGPRPIREFRITVPANQLRWVRLFLVLGLPGAVLALGAGVWLWKRI